MIKPYFENENGKLYLGDCLEVMEGMEKNSVEITVTSPPYNINKRYSDYKKSKTSEYMSERYKKWYKDEMPEWEYQGWQQSVIHELLRVSNSSIFYNHRVRYAWHNRNLYRSPSNIYHPLDWLNKFPIWCEIIWDRCGIGNPSNRYHICEERIYQIGKPKKWNNSLGLTNIWRVPPSRNDGHVCTFPQKIVENCVVPTTDEGDIVFDPFIGGGTTAFVCEELKRKWIGIEISEEYCENIVKKIQIEKIKRKNREGLNGQRRRVLKESLCDS